MTAGPATDAICAGVKIGRGRRKGSKDTRARAGRQGHGGARELGKELGGSMARGSPGSDAGRTSDGTQANEIG